MSQRLNYRKQVGDLSWQGAVNAREICGNFYRMGRHEWVSALGWQQMHEDGVRKVVDLRNPAEIQRREHDPAVPAASLAQIEMVNLPLETSGNERFEAVAVPYMNHTNMYQLVCEEFGDQLRAVFENLANSHGSTVIHCSAGRDRSGLVATLLLDLAGCGDQILRHDELAVRGINEWHRVSPRKHPYERFHEARELQGIIDERAQALREFCAWMGSTQAYLERQDMDPKVIERVRDLAQNSS